jgi:hypothetical protein
MGKVRSALIELKPADNAVIGEIFSDTSLRNSQVFGEPRFDGLASAAAGASAQEISDGDAERLASFDIIVAGEIGIGENEYSRTGRSVIRITQLHRRTRQEAAQLHLESGQPGRKAGITGAAAHTGAGGLGSGLYRKSRNGARMGQAARFRV